MNLGSLIPWNEYTGRCGGYELFVIREENIFHKNKHVTSNVDIFASFDLCVTAKAPVGRIFFTRL